MGIVWRARDERLRRTVAVKQLLPRPGFDQPLTQYARLRAMREARIAARLQHPNVVTVFDVVEEDDQPWLIMEYVPSRSLALVLREFGPMKPYEVADMGAQAAAGLAAAHAVGVVHRDVKPGNVLLGDDGVVKITDFGISRSLDDVVATGTGLVTGTPAYLAPEVARGMTPEPASDVFALGSTLYAAVQGTPPFGVSDNPLAILNLVAAGKVTPPPNGGPLTPLLMTMLQRTPDTRPTMRQVAEELAAVAAQRTVSALPVREPGRAWTKPVVEPVSRPEPEPPILIEDIAFAPSSILADPGDLAGDLFAINEAALPGTQAVRRPRRRPVRLAMVVVIALIAVGTAVFVVNRTGQGGTPQAAPPQATTTVPPTLPAGPPSFVAMTNLVTKYYGLLPADQNDAYLLLSSKYHAKISFAEFSNFYNTIAQVVPNNFHQVGPNTITAVINFVTVRGAVTHEPYRFTIASHDGLLVIDNAIQVTRAST